MALEAHTARLAAQRAQPAHLLRLQATIDAIADAPLDAGCFLAENRVFHLAVAGAAQNRVLRLIMGSLRELMQQSLNPLAAGGGDDRAVAGGAPGDLRRQRRRPAGRGRAADGRAPAGAGAARRERQ